MNLLDGILQKAAALLFAGGAILYFATNLSVFGMASKITGSYHEADNPRDPWKGKNLTILDHRNSDGRGFKPGYLAMVRGEDIRADRFVSITAYVTVDELLKDGERRPEKSMEEVFAKSRAVIFARAECERLLQSLARECAVASAEGRIADGVVRIEALFRFVQRDDFGALDDGATYVFTTADNRLADRVQISRAGSAGARVALYKKAAAECAAIRRRDGSCSIIGLRIDASNEGGGLVRHSATANYAFLIGDAG